MPEYLTSSEVARYLRLNQKKIYALVTQGELPAARISGTWLFPKELVDEWLNSHTVNRSGGATDVLLDRVLVLQGSDDGLLSRVIDRFQQRFGAAIPMATVGSLRPRWTTVGPFPGRRRDRRAALRAARSRGIRSRHSRRFMSHAYRETTETSCERTRQT